MPPDSLPLLEREIVECGKCPRLREHCAEVARVKRRAYRDQEYWGKPVPGFGDPNARVLIVGLAPGAHGANRTGRVFTGDRSGDFLFRALHETGFANRAESVAARDGLALRDCWIAAAARCAPPGNKPTPEEFRNCRPYLERELRLLRQLKVVVCLGRLGWDAYLAASGQARADFGHGLVYADRAPALVGCYHPSQQNTSTGRLTAEMLRKVFATVRGMVS